MKTQTTNRLVLLIITTMIFCAATTIFSIDSAAQEGQSVEQAREVVASVGEETDSDEWIAKLSTPGPEHKRLDELSGQWDVVVKLWASPDEKPVELKGTVTREWVLDGLFLKEQVENANEIFEGGVFRYIGYFGYNRMTGLFEHIWMSNESSGMYLETGRYNPASKVIGTSGMYTDPGTGFVMLNRTEIAILGPNRHILTGYITPENGQEFKEIEVHYTRRKQER